jgi:prepilin peptidase CpaA
MVLDIVFTIAFTAMMAAAAGFDLWKRRIPNALTVAVLIGGLFARGVTGGFASLGSALVGAGLGLAIMLLPFTLRWIGGGDVKLIAAAGAWLGPIGVIEMIVLGLAGGGAIALAVLAVGGRQLRRDVAQNLRNAWLARRAPDAPRRERSQLVPLGVALGAAATVVLFCMGGMHG